MELLFCKMFMVLQNEVLLKQIYLNHLHSWIWLQPILRTYVLTFSIFSVWLLLKEHLSDSPM